MHIANGKWQISKGKLELDLTQKRQGQIHHEDTKTQRKAIVDRIYRMNRIGIHFKWQTENVKLKQRQKKIINHGFHGLHGKISKKYMPQRDTEKHGEIIFICFPR